MRATRIPLPLLVLACLAALAVAGPLFPAGAAADWGPPQTVERVESGPSEDSDLQLLGNPRGDRALVWTTGSGDGYLTTWERWWPAGGSLGPARQIGTSGQAVGPQAVLAPDGTGAVAWGARVAVRPPGGDWGAPETLPASDHSQLIVDARGTAYLMWVSSPNGGDLYVATRPPGGPFGEPQILARDVELARAAADGAGNLLVAWVRAPRRPGEGDVNRPAYLEIAERDAARRLGTVRRVATGRLEIQPREGRRILSLGSVEVARGATGAALVTWWERDRGMRYVSWAEGGLVNAPLTLFGRSLRSVEGLGGTALAVGPSGRAVVVHGGRARFGSTAGTFGPAQPLYRPPGLRTAGVSGVAIDGRGRAVALLAGLTARDQSRLFALTRPPGGRFGAAQAIGRPFESFTEVTVDDRGTSTAAFLHEADAFATKRLQVVTDEPRYTRPPAVGVAVAAPALTRRGRSVSAALRRGIVVRLYLSKGARFSLVLRMRGARALVGRASGRFGRAGMREVRLRLTAAGRRRLRAAGGATLTVSARARDPQGRRGTASRTLRLGRAR